MLCCGWCVWFFCGLCCFCFVVFCLGCGLGWVFVGVLYCLAGAV